MMRWLKRRWLAKWLPDGVVLGSLYFHLSERHRRLSIYWFYEELLPLMSLRSSDEILALANSLHNHSASFLLPKHHGDYCSLYFAICEDGYEVQQVFTPETDARKTISEYAQTFRLRKWGRVQTLIDWLEAQHFHMKAIEQVRVERFYRG